MNIKLKTKILEKGGSQLQIVKYVDIDVSDFYLSKIIRYLYATAWV